MASDPREVDPSVQDVLDVLVPPKRVEVRVYGPGRAGGPPGLEPVHVIPGLLRGREVSVSRADTTIEQRAGLARSSLVVVREARGDGSLNPTAGFIKHPNYPVGKNSRARLELRYVD